MAWLEKVLDFIIPRNCAGCGSPSEVFCNACMEISYTDRTACLFCGQRNLTGAVCPECKRRTKTPLTQVFWAGKYDNELKKAVWELKYGKRRELAKPLGQMLARKFFEISNNPEAEQHFVAIPIPLHFKKEHERGFNQALLLAEEFGKAANIRVLPNVLEKIRETEEQVKVQDKILRLKNLEDAFSVIGPLPEKAAIILVDDVATSGATLTHASLALKKAGAKKIFGLVAAHGGQ